MASEWRDIVNAPNYEVSRDGLIRNKTTHFVLKPSSTNRVRIGYKGRPHNRSIKEIRDKAYLEEEQR